MSRVRNKTENRYPQPGNPRKQRTPSQDLEPKKKYPMDMSADCPHDVHRKCPRRGRGNSGENPLRANCIQYCVLENDFDSMAARRRADKTKTGPAAAAALAKISLQMKRKAFYFDFPHTPLFKGKCFGTFSVSVFICRLPGREGEHPAFQLVFYGGNLG